MKQKIRFTMHDVYKHFNAEFKVKPATSPRAQSSTLLQPCTPTTTAGFDMVAFASQWNTLEVFELAVIELMFMWGLRVSEVLQVNTSDISKSGNIRIKALKGSNFRVVRSSLYSSFWLDSDATILPLNAVYSRFYFYRLFKRVGLYGHFGNNCNNSVTHYFRHLRGLDVQDTFNDWDLTANALGHKSSKSTLYYGKRQK